MIVAGLTGGIASGKSTVSALFEAAGAIVIDADKIAREVVKKGLPAWRAVVDHFGRTGKSIGPAWPISFSTKRRPNAR